MTVKSTLSASILTAATSLLTLPALAVDTDLQKSILAQYEAGELKGLHSVLVYQRGEILAEAYFSGQDQRWGQGKTGFIAAGRRPCWPS